MSGKVPTIIQKKIPGDGNELLWTDVWVVVGNTAEAIKNLRNTKQPGEYRIVAFKKHVTITVAKVKIAVNC